MATSIPIIISIAFILIISIFILYKTIKNQTIPSFTNIAQLILLMAVIIFFVVDFAIQKKVSNDIIRTIVTSLTLIIAICSFSSTYLFSSKNSKVTKENQEANFIMTLLTNNYKILESQQKALDALIKDLHDTFRNNSIPLKELADEFVTYVGTNNTVALKIGQMSTTLQSSTQDDYKLLRDLSMNGSTAQTAALHLLVTYFKQHQTDTNYKEFYSKLDKPMRSKAFSSATIQECQKTTLFDDVTSFLNFKFTSIVNQQMTYDKIYSHCTIIFDRNYKEVGHFFRNSHRVVKLINSTYKDNLEEKKKFLGLLRSHYSENVILAIFYNCIYSDKGIGFTEQLFKSDFFGTKEDLEKTQPQHFLTENMIDPKIEIDLMRRIFTSTSTIELPTKDKGNPPKEIDTKTALALYIKENYV